MRNRVRLGCTRVFAAATPSGIQAKSGSLLLRRDDLGANVLPEWRASCRPLQLACLDVFCHLRIQLTTGSGGYLARAIRSGFLDQPLRCPDKKSDFSSFAIKRLLSCPVLAAGRMYDASRECWWRAPISLLHSFLSHTSAPLFCFLRLVNSRFLSTASRQFFCDVRMIKGKNFLNTKKNKEKQEVYSYANLLRERYACSSSIAESSARASPFSLLCARIADWIVIGYMIAAAIRTTRSSLPVCVYSFTFEGYLPVRYLCKAPSLAPLHRKRERARER